uniref:Uncharacterized protein n=1 Tax=Trichobilharzia regenti TaxID=157069 RepID=A0AA85JB32_TRIRE|nr:unnamed protein product [Trichobilharzia regenti]
MHNDRRHLKPDSEASIADTIRVVSCKQNRDLRITFANDFACSDRQKWPGCKAVCSTPGPASREANSHRIYHQSGNAVHRSGRPSRNHVNNGFLISSDSHTPFRCASANRHLPVTQSAVHHNNRHPMHASHTTAAQQEQYKRDLMTQYEIQRALFLANPPPSVLASRNREKKLNDNRRLDMKSHPVKQTPLNGPRVDRSVIGRMNLDHQRVENSFRGALSLKSAREIGLHEVGGRFSYNFRGYGRPSRGHFQNNFHRGRGSKPYWCHDDRFEKLENGGGSRGQNSSRNGEHNTRQHSGDEYIDDLTPEEIAKYKLEINMDNFIVDRPILPDPILSVPLSKWQSDDLLLLFSSSSTKSSSNRHRFINQFQKQQRQQHHHQNYTNNNQQHHRHQTQRNQSNAHSTPSRKEVVTRPNQRTRSSNVPNIPNNHNVSNENQVSSETPANSETNNDKSVGEINSHGENQVNDDKVVGQHEKSAESAFYEQDIGCEFFDIHSHDRARSFLTLGIYDSELSQNDGYTHSIYEQTVDRLDRFHSLPSLRNIEKSDQPLLLEDCAKIATKQNANDEADTSGVVTTEESTSTEPGGKDNSQDMTNCDIETKGLTKPND